MNTIGYFEIHSTDPIRDMEFYQVLFGWKFTIQDGLPIEYYHIETGGIQGGLLKRPTLPPEPEKNAFVCSIQVDDFDKVSQQILDAGGETALPKFAVPGKCWQGYFNDPGGNTFGIFEADENAR